MPTRKKRSPKKAKPTTEINPNESTTGSHSEATPAGWQPPPQIEVSATEFAKHRHRLAADTLSRARNHLSKCLTTAEKANPLTGQGIQADIDLQLAIHEYLYAHESYLHLANQILGGE